MRSAWAAVLLTVLVFTWLVTYGDWRLFDAEDFGQFYDYQAASLLRGTLEVPKEAVRSEAFIRDGRVFGYYGVAPAVPRILMNFLVPFMEGRWSRLLLLAGCALNLLCVWWLARDAGLAPRWRWAALLLAGLGSTNIFLASRAYVNHEVIMWASASALAAHTLVIRFGRTRDVRWLLFACLLAAFALSTRASSGMAATIGCAAAIALHFRRHVEPKKLAAPAAILALGLTAFIGVNYARFGTLLSGMPPQYYIQFQEDPARVERIKGTQIHPGNLPFTAANYLVVPQIATGRPFPWLRLTQESWRVIDPVLDFVGHYASIPASSPFLLILAVLAAVCVAKRLPHWRIPLAAALLGGMPMLIMPNMEERFLHDLYPFFAISLAPGLQSIEDRRWSRFVIPFGVAWGCVVYPLLGLTFQREVVWGVTPEKRAAWTVFRGQMDSLFSGGRPLEVLELADGARLPRVALAGQIARLRKTGSLYWWNGAAWRHLGGENVFLTDFPLDVTFPKQPKNPAEPLLTYGRAEMGGFIYVKYESAGRVRIGFDNWGSGGPLTAPLDVSAGRPSRIHIFLDRLARSVAVEFDGREVLRTSAELEGRLTGYWIGENPIGGSSAAARFSGAIRWLSGPAPGEAEPDFVRELDVRFPAKNATSTEPLLTYGATGDGGFFFVRYTPGGITFGLDNWGEGGPESRPVAVRPDEPHRVRIAINTIERRVSVKLDGQTVLEHSGPDLAARLARGVTVGSNRIGGSSTGPRFSGEIREAAR